MRPLSARVRGAGRPPGTTSEPTSAVRLEDPVARDASRLFRGLVEPSAHIGDDFLVGYHSAGPNVCFTLLDSVNEVDVIQDILKRAVVGQAAQNRTYRLLGFHVS